MERKCYRIVGPSGEVYTSAGARWIAEAELERGFVWDTDEDGATVQTPLPDGCRITEHGG